MMNPHISSFLLQARPDAIAAACRYAAACGAEIIWRDAARGRAVGVLEAESDGELARVLAELAGLPGVVGANMVCHFSPEAAAADGGAGVFDGR